MSNVIDWSKYGRKKKRHELDTSVTYRRQIICTASFPVGKFEAVKAMIEAQIVLGKTPCRRPRDARRNEQGLHRQLLEIHGNHLRNFQCRTVNFRAAHTDGKPLHGNSLGQIQLVTSNIGRSVQSVGDIFGRFLRHITGLPLSVDAHANTP
ncbi:hypothetical protein C6P72_07810 [Burkholderia gladioli]|nr:hypothetical protein C6P72_07810 [Burkholderia gladioli]